MGCCGDREKMITVKEEQKWDYVNLKDFKSSSCVTIFSYIWLWILVFVTIAIYAVDTFIAVNLLAFDRWSSQVQPAIPFEVSKWIFSVCILLSWVIAGFDWIRAIRVIRRGSVAETYLDPLAVVLQSIRPGRDNQGGGWRRFLVFAELTKSKKGTDYIALFVYFQFKGAIRIIFAEGPRMVVNAITLYSVAQAEFVPVGDHASEDGVSDFEQFFINIEALAQESREQVMVLGSMVFTVVIWVISALGLIAAIILYLVFLWHYIPSSDGSLSNYCRRKVDNRLERVVSVKVQKALEKTDQMIRAQELQAAKNGTNMCVPSNTSTMRQPTLPHVMGDGDDSDSKGGPPSVGLVRRDTQTSVASSTLTGSTAANSTNSSRLPDIAEKAFGGIGPRPQPERSQTQGSGWSSASYGSNAPLIGNSGPMGYSDVHSLPSSRNGSVGTPTSSQTSLPYPSDDGFSFSDGYRRPSLGRTLTGASQSSLSSSTVVSERSFTRNGTPGPGMGPGPMNRNGTPGPMNWNGTPGPANMGPPPPGPVSRNGTPGPNMMAPVGLSGWTGRSAPARSNLDREFI
ncbi:hypothetical protein BDY21DRAFT_152172 [Lineolata rhizophorae]|uniref:Pheromone-regulated membrane protein n=1 Tax=Lineolata rhizophorae TaxID=578093 RepID=A0A6A6NMC3_9PEZI|nr:hypothetical protein BDY21DRAFT_152172 [Lineolata rhizophorae]